MNPGRELDALVAEKVMGLELAGELYGDGDFVYLSPSEPWSTLKAWSPVPHYSTSIADAWLVVEKLQCQGHDDKWFFMLEYDSVETWDCAFYKESNSDGGGPDGWATATTAPHAICLAALKAVGEVTK